MYDIDLSIVVFRDVSISRVPIYTNMYYIPIIIRVPVIVMSVSRKLYSFYYL